MSAKLGRRTFTQRAGAIAMAAALPMPAIAEDKPVQDRPPHGEDRAARAGRHPDGAGHQPVPQAPWPEARRPMSGNPDILLP